MARGRMLSVSIADDIDFNNMSMEAQFLFMRTVPHLDRDGLIVGTPLLLLAKVAPLMMDKLNATTSSIIEEWINVGSVIRYQHEKKDVLFFVNFGKNQGGLRYDRESPSSYPPPPGFVRGNDGLVPDNKPADKTPETDGTEQLRSNAGVLTEQLPCKVEVEVEEKAATHARTHENTRNEKMPTAAAALPEPVRVVEKESGKYQNFIDSYERIWGLTIASPYQAEKIEDWAKRVAISAWEYALQQAADNRKNGNWRYFETILNRVEVEGVAAQSTQKQQAAQSSPKLIDARDRDDIPDYLREALQGR